MTLKSLNYPQEENGGKFFRETERYSCQFDDSMYCLVEKGSQESMVLFDEVLFSPYYYDGYMMIYDMTDCT